MPRKIKIHEQPNPTGLTMTERQLALDVLQSLRVSVAKLRREARDSYWRNGWDSDDEKEVWDRAIRAAINQLAGRQKSEEGHFRLIHNDADVADKDYDYVLRSITGSLPS